MLKEELFINELDGRQLKRIFHVYEEGEDSIVLIREIATGIEYEEVVVLPSVSIDEFEEVIE